MLEPRSITEVCYVTHDLEKTVSQWARALGAGPFYKISFGADMTLSYRGQPGRDSFDVALGFSGTTLIEIAQPTNDAPSIFQEILRARGDGAVHHVYPNIRPLNAAEFDAQCQAYRELGYAEGAWMQPPGMGRNVFFDAVDSLGYFIEVLEFNMEAYDRINRPIYAAHEQWDGRNPLRDIAELFG